MDINKKFMVRARLFFLIPFFFETAIQRKGSAGVQTQKRECARHSGARAKSPASPSRNGQTRGAWEAAKTWLNDRRMSAAQKNGNEKPAKSPKDYQKKELHKTTTC